MYCNVSSWPKYTQEEHDNDMYVGSVIKELMQ